MILTRAEDVTGWLKLQEEIVILVSAFLAPVKAYLQKCESDSNHAEDMASVYQLHTVVQDWDEMQLLKGLKKLNLEPYYHPIRDPRYKLVIHTTHQTIPSRRRAGAEFQRMIKGEVDAMSEAMLALAKVPPPPFSVTLAAGTPFSAYLLILRLVEAATQYLYIADAYLDASIFDRYLYRAKDTVCVSLRTNPANWKNRGWKEQFEQAEALFVAQHSSYDRADRTDLHARYIITETGAWRIDGSIKDVAATKDCPIHTIRPEERDKVVADLFS